MLSGVDGFSVPGECIADVLDHVSMSNLLHRIDNTRHEVSRDWQACQPRALASVLRAYLSTMVGNQEKNLIKIK